MANSARSRPSGRSHTRTVPSGEPGSRRVDGRLAAIGEVGQVSAGGVGLELPREQPAAARPPARHSQTKRRRSNDARTFRTSSRSRRRWRPRRASRSPPPPWTRASCRSHTRYGGEGSTDDARRVVEDADLVLDLGGVILNDTVEGLSAHLDAAKIVTSGRATCPSAPRPSRRPRAQDVQPGCDEGRADSPDPGTAPGSQRPPSSALRVRHGSRCRGSNQLPRRSAERCKRSWPPGTSWSPAEATRCSCCQTSYCRRASSTSASTCGPRSDGPRRPRSARPWPLRTARSSWSKEMGHLSRQRAVPAAVYAVGN